MKILVFTKKGQETPSFPQRPGLEVQHVCFNSSKLDDLMLVAKYRILNYPSTLVIDSRGKVLIKMRGSVPDNYLDTLGG